MLFNVWVLIWPNQQKILGMKPATDPEKAKARRVAFLASRTNTMLSIPMLFFMVASGGVFTDRDVRLSVRADAQDQKRPASCPGVFRSKRLEPRAYCVTQSPVTLPLLRRRRLLDALRPSRRA